MAKLANISKADVKSTTRANSADNQLREIEKLAYQFFIDRGQQHGFDQEDWARAEAIIRKKK